MNPTPQITIRRSEDRDFATVMRLAALDSKPFRGGPMLLAEAGDEVVAALSLETGDITADPFHRTTELVAMLELRAALEREQADHDGGRRRPLRVERSALREAWARAAAG